MKKEERSIKERGFEKLLKRSRGDPLNLPKGSLILIIRDGCPYCVTALPRLKESLLRNKFRERIFFLTLSKEQVIEKQWFHPFVFPTLIAILGKGSYLSLEGDLSLNKIERFLLKVERLLIDFN